MRRFSTKRQRCDEAYRRLREELGRPVLPLDLWNRTDVPPLADFRSAYKTWVECQRAHKDERAWAKGFVGEHLALRFLAAIESDWQAQRVTPYALVWGLARQPENPALGYEQFFETWPQWARERSPLSDSKTWDTVRKKLGACLVADRLAKQIRVLADDDLLLEVQGRILYTANGDYQERHGGVLRTPGDLNLFARYGRPEIIRHFGVHYDPAKHNTGMLWFGNDGVIITKLDTSSAKERHQYANRILDSRTFSWTSQNQMGTANVAGRRVVEHEARGLRLHLFLQPRSHEPACYLGLVRFLKVKGTSPMVVTCALEIPLPDDVMRELNSTTLE